MYGINVNQRNDYDELKDLAEIVPLEDRIEAGKVDNTIGKIKKILD